MLLTSEIWPQVAVVSLQERVQQLGDRLVLQVLRAVAAGLHQSATTYVRTMNNVRIVP